MWYGTRGVVRQVERENNLGLTITMIFNGGNRKQIQLAGLRKDRFRPQSPPFISKPKVTQQLLLLHALFSQRGD